MSVYRISDRLQRVEKGRKERRGAIPLDAEMRQLERRIGKDITLAAALDQLNKHHGMSMTLQQEVQFVVRCSEDPVGFLAERKKDAHIPWRPHEHLGDIEDKDEMARAIVDSMMACGQEWIESGRVPWS